MGTRISAQVRSHAQKVLKDYSPSGTICDRDRSKSVVTETANDDNVELVAAINK